MTHPITSMRWTTADLDLLPDNGNRYEIIDGVLQVTRAPHWRHQEVCSNLIAELRNWSRRSGRGRVAGAPGVIFSDTDHVIPDVAWISQERLDAGLDPSGHLILAPELVIEVLSAGWENIRRDRDLKLRLYSARGVQEYWVVDWRSQQIEIYRRDQAALTLVMTLHATDDLTTPLLPGFTCAVDQLFE